ncbi:MAG: hypothetical protein JO165_05905, partial [Candidatus Eremiobacteraeota bacterium]|nr:hypothetical protein [Candidatus Eremiobacteraeota bacterium]
IGWVRADESVIARLTRLKTTSDLATPLWCQVVAAKAMKNIEEIRAFRRALFSEKVRFALALLQKHLPEWECEMPRGGFVLWAKLPVADTRPFAQLARRYGVNIIGGAAMTFDDSSRNYVRISCTLDDARIALGVERLAQAWTAFRSKPYAHLEPAELLVV